MTEVMYLATVRGDAIRRARQIDREQAQRIERHLLFHSPLRAQAHLGVEAEKFWEHAVCSKNNGVSYIRVAAVANDPHPLLFGTVQMVEVRNED